MTIKARFDGKVFVPEEPVELREGEEVLVEVPSTSQRGCTGAEIVQHIKNNPELTEMWNRIAAGRDSTEVARELRLKASQRSHEP